MGKSFPIVLVILLFLSLLLFTNNRTPVFYAVSGLVQSVFATPKHLLYTAGIQKQDSSEIQTLREQNKQLLEKMVSFQEMKKENEALKSQFQDSPLSIEQLVSVRVVGFKGPAQKPHTLVIDKGEKNGIKKGMTVVSGKHVVGIVESILAHYASVMLPNHTGFSTLAKTLETDSMGILKGTGDSVILDQIVISDKLEKGNIVVTRGKVDSNGIGMHPDLIVGKIRSIKKTDTGSFQSAQIESLINYSRLSTVFVVTQ